MALVRLAFLVAVIVAAVLVARDCVPARVVHSSPSPAVTATSAPSPTATQPATFTMTVTDAELTAAASASFPQTVSGVTVRDPVVRTMPSDVRLTATARVFFGTMQFAMTGRPYASAGRVAVRVDSVTLGGVELPDSVRASTQSTVEGAIARLVPPSVIVQSVSLGSGTVTIEGVTPR
jgi:hypothetical protein